MAKYLKVTASGATRSGTSISWYVTFSVTDNEYYIQIRDDNGRTTSAANPNHSSITVSDTVSGTIYSPGAGSKTTSAAYWYQSEQGDTLTYYEGLDATVSWSAMTLTVTFNKNGGNTPSQASKSVTYGAAYGTLPTCTRTGYTFAGWYTAASGGTKITSASTVSVTANQTLYAHWTANTYTGTFDLRGGKIGGSGENQTKTETFDSAWVFPADPTRAGYTFAGWYTAASGGTQVTGETIYSTAGPQTLYARWTGNTLTCSFDARGGTVSPAGKSVVCGETYGALPAPARSGYRFLGWFPTIYSEEAVTDATPVTATGDHTIYARWEAMSVLHLAENGTARTITNIKVVENGTVRDIVGCYSVENGEVHQGV